MERSEEDKAMKDYEALARLCCKRELLGTVTAT